MPTSIKEFLNRPDIKEIKRHSKSEMMGTDFFRDPFRVLTYNENLMYAHADGVVLYAKEMEADEPYDIKGCEFTLQEMLDDDDYTDRSLVVGIFMTALSVHTNRVPINSYYLKQRNTNPIQTHGVSMIMEENSLLDDFCISKKGMDYLVYNEKKISTFYSPAIKGRYYVVQVADKDVDCCLSWRVGQHLIQGTRFGQIRFGSQCELVIPLRGTRFKPLVKPLDYVEAGIDPIVEML